MLPWEMFDKSVGGGLCVWDDESPNIPEVSPATLLEGLADLQGRFAVGSRCSPAILESVSIDLEKLEGEFKRLMKDSDSPKVFEKAEKGLKGCQELHLKLKGALN